jgi:hypothetical protein
MPYKFTFKVQNETYFAANLICEQCRGQTKHGIRCSRNTCIGTSWCFQHLASNKHLRIQKSTLPNAGKGIFAVDVTSKEPTTIVFRNGQQIIAYDGEMIHKDTTQERYGDYTAPYGIRVTRTIDEDGALHRGIGTLVNHQPTKRANARFSVARNPTRIVLVATKNIHHGKEIFVNYGSDYRFNEPTFHTTK